MDPRENDDGIGSIEELDCLFDSIGQELIDEEMQKASEGTSLYPEPEDDDDVWRKLI